MGSVSIWAALAALAWFYLNGKLHLPSMSDPVTPELPVVPISGGSQLPSYLEAIAVLNPCCETEDEAKALQVLVAAALRVSRVDRETA